MLVTHVYSANSYNPESCHPNWHSIGTHQYKPARKYANLPLFSISQLKIHDFKCNKPSINSRLSRSFCKLSCQQVPYSSRRSRSSPHMPFCMQTPLDMSCPTVYLQPRIMVPGTAPTLQSFFVKNTRLGLQQPCCILTQ